MTRLADLVTVDRSVWLVEPSAEVDITERAWALRHLCRMQVQYTRSADGRASPRIVDPYGLVATSGRRYLIADEQGTGRLFTLEQLSDCTPLDAPAALRSGHTRRTVWAALKERAESPGRVSVTVRLLESRLDLVRCVSSSSSATTSRYFPPKEHANAFVRSGRTWQSVSRSSPTTGKRDTRPLINLPAQCCYEHLGEEVAAAPSGDVHVESIRVDLGARKDVNLTAPHAPRFSAPTLLWSTARPMPLDLTATCAPPTPIGTGASAYAHYAPAVTNCSMDPGMWSPAARGVGAALQCSSLLRGDTTMPAPFVDGAGIVANHGARWSISARGLRGSARRSAPGGPAGPQERPG